MKKKFKKIITSILVIVFCFSVGAVTKTVNASDTLKNFKSSLTTTSGAAGYATGDGATNLEGMISKVVQTALSLIGVLFLILMIYGGFLWMTDRGNEDQVKKAKSLITAAVIGLIIVVSAYAISYLVIMSSIKGTLEGT